MSLDHLPISAFDLVFVATLAIGIMRGRKHGMSEELLPMLTWLGIVIGCSLAYEPLGRFLFESSPSLLTATGSLGVLSWYYIAYILVGIIIFAAFSALTRTMGGKLLGSDVFGRSEYYLGMGAGAVRFVCMLLVGMALLNACYVSPMEVQAREKYQRETYGGEVEFPGLNTAQTIVFKASFAGSWIKSHARFLLIKATRPNQHTISIKDVDLDD